MLQVKLPQLMMESKGESYSDINFFHRVVQNQRSQKIPQASHVMSIPLSLMESRSELSSDINFLHRVVGALCTVGVGRFGRGNSS